MMLKKYLSTSRGSFLAGNIVGLFQMSLVHNISTPFLGLLAGWVLYIVCSIGFQAYVGKDGESK